MRAVIYLAARELRARWRDWALLVLLVAAAGGAVLAAAAGASRTQSAYPRFLTASKASFDVGLRQQANAEKETALGVALRIAVQ